MKVCYQIALSVDPWMSYTMVQTVQTCFPEKFSKSSTANTSSSQPFGRSPSPTTCLTTSNYSSSPIPPNYNWKSNRLLPHQQWHQAISSGQQCLSEPQSRHLCPCHAPQFSNQSHTSPRPSAMPQQLPQPLHSRRPPGQKQKRPPDCANTPQP